MTKTLRSEGLISPLFTVEGSLVEEYNRALSHVTKLTTKLEKFHIDRRGKSPELVEELGKGYLQVGDTHRYMITVSPLQEKASLLDPEFTFDNRALDSLYSNHLEGIGVVSRVDGLYGEFDDNIRAYDCIDDLLGVSQVKIQLHTPSGFIAKARELKHLQEDLENDPNLMIKNDSTHLRSMLELVKQVGDVRGYPITNMSTTHNIGSYFTTFLGGVYIIREREPPRREIKIRRPDRADEHIEERVISSNTMQSTVIGTLGDLHETPLIQAIPLSDTARVIKFALSKGYVTYDDELIESRLNRLEDIRLLTQGVDVASLNYTDRQLSVHELHRTPEYAELIDVQRRCRNGREIDAVVKDCSPVTKAMLLSANTKIKLAPLVEHLLNTLWPHDFERTFKNNPWVVESMYGAATPVFQSYMLKCLQDARDSNE